MSDFSAPQCNVCRRLKAETNHWLIAVTSPRYKGICFVPAEHAGERDEDFAYEDICGQGCAAKRFSLWLMSWMAPQAELGDRASTLVLNPPLTRDGREASAVQESVNR
jgi:hypothetical protein